MSHEQTNGSPPDPAASLRLSEEEWKRYNAELEAKWTPRLSDEERALAEEARWAEDDPEIQEKYADQVVAVRNRQIIAAGENLLEVLAEAERVTGLPRHRIAVATIYGPKHFLQDH
jgi:hypothetical protein